MEELTYDKDKPETHKELFEKYKEERDKGREKLMEKFAKPEHKECMKEEGDRVSLGTSSSSSSSSSSSNEEDAEKF